MGGWNLIRDGELARRLTGTDLDEGTVIAVRPDEIEVSRDADGVNARVVARNYLGARAELWLTIGGKKLRMVVEPGLEPKAELRIRVASFRQVSD